MRCVQHGADIPPSREGIVVLQQDRPMRSHFLLCADEDGNVGWLAQRCLSQCDDNSLDRLPLLEARLAHAQHRELCTMRAVGVLANDSARWKSEFVVCATCTSGRAVCICRTCATRCHTGHRIVPLPSE